MTLVCALLIVLLPAALLAQEPEQADVWSGAAEVSFVSTSGNTDTRTLGVGAEINYQRRRWSGLLKLHFVESKTDDVVNARSFRALLEASSSLTPHLGTYGRIGYLKDTFAGLDDRLSSEGGISYELVSIVPHSLSTLIGLGFTREVRVRADNLSLATANATMRYSWALSQTSALTNDATFTGDMRNARDWRLTNDLALTAGLGRIFSLKFSQTLSYLNEPVPGFRNRDIVTSAALVANF